MKTWTCPFHTSKQWSQLVWKTEQNLKDLMSWVENCDDSSKILGHTPTQVLQTLESIHAQYIDHSQKEDHMEYIFALRDFMEVTFGGIIQDIDSYTHFSSLPKPLAKILQAVQRLKDIILPDSLRLTLKNSVRPEDWKCMILVEFPEQGDNLVLAARNYNVSLELLVSTLQWGWENAVDGMFDVLSRAEKFSSGDMSKFDEYCKNAEKFLIRLSATSLSVHSILLVDRKRIIHENTIMKDDELMYLKNLYIWAAEKTLERSDITESTKQVSAFASIPRKWCPALHAKDQEGNSYILVFFRIFQKIYKEQLLKM